MNSQSMVIRSKEKDPILDQIKKLSKFPEKNWITLKGKANPFSPGNDGTIDTQFRFYYGQITNPKILKKLIAVGMEYVITPPHPEWLVKHFTKTDIWTIFSITEVKEVFIWNWECQDTPTENAIFFQLANNNFLFLSPHHFTEALTQPLWCRKEGIIFTAPTQSHITPFVEKQVSRLE